MNFNELIITCNVALSTPEGVSLTPGVYFKATADNQLLTVGETHYNVILHAWNDEACCNANKAVIAIDPLHDAVDIGTDPEIPIWQALGGPVYFKIPITDATDVDTDAKVKALVINELATALSKQPTDFS